MTDAILGSYADFKLVKTRSVVQVVIEVPLERAHEALHVDDAFVLLASGWSGTIWSTASRAADASR